MGGAVLAYQTEGTALGCPESFLQNHHGSAATLRAQMFPSANSHCFAEALRASAWPCLVWRQQEIA